MAKRVRQFRLRWLGHLSRMNDERLPKQIFYAPPIPPEGDRVWDTEVQKQWRRANGWKRRPGGQRTTWSDVIESDLKGFIRRYMFGNHRWAEAVQSLSRNRTAWRDVTKNL